jgi:hypothetical protein
MATTPSVPEPVFQFQADGPPRAARSLSEAGEAGFSSRTITAVASGLLLFVAGLAGGGRGGLGDSLAQLLALALLAWLCWLGASRRLAWHAPAWVRWLPALALALPLFQLLPVPGWIWSLGSARGELALQLGQAGVALPHVLTLAPAATEQALWSLLPATALFLSVLTMTRKGQRAMLAGIVVLAVGNVIMGMAQVSGGNDSPLRLYAHTNLDQAVGFFANRNHLAALLVMALPIALGWTTWSAVARLRGRPVSVIRVIGGCLLVVLLILGIALTRSRAGLLLGMLAVFGSLPIVMALGPQRGARRILALTLAVAVMLSMQFSIVGVLHRLHGATQEDGRWRYTTTTLQAAQAYAPLGSGLGTFRQAFQPFEAKGHPTRYIVNHAHDDFVELWLEGGVPALVLLAAGIAAWLRQGLLLLRSKGDGDAVSLGRLLSRCAWWAGSLGLLHSALDYPLRTTAAMAVFAILAAVAFSHRAVDHRHTA